jgi:23S rRNA (pseudouridine1915-N3)-methyltransferase
LRLKIIAVGRLKSGPEFALVDAYRTRLASAPAQLGPLEITELDERKDARRIGEAFDDAIARLAPGAKLVALDERGEPLTTRVFADRLSAWRDAGAPEAAFLIGGADSRARSDDLAASSCSRDAGRAAISRRESAGRAPLSPRMTGDAPARRVVDWLRSATEFP